jgi:uncharacterized membrane protein
MVESAVGREAARFRRIGGRREPLRVVSFCIKVLVVLFPLPTAFLTDAPPEMKLAGVYVTLVTLGLFLALADVAGSVRRLAEAMDQQRRGS